MALARVLVEEFQPEVIKWLRERVELVVINPWVEPQRWELELTRVDAVISRKGKITREQMERNGGRLKIIARTGHPESISKPPRSSRYG
jgi:lactate dehydrogenase-like 2-hydroxyacid dehydrogenase